MRFFSLFAFLLVILSTATDLSAQEKVVFHGQVVDPDGVAIPNAKIRLHASYDYSPNWKEVEKTANDSGQFEYTLPHPVSAQQRVSLHITASNSDSSLLENTRFSYSSATGEWTYGIRPIEEFGLVKTSPTQKVELKLVTPDGKAAPRMKVRYVDASSQYKSVTPNYYVFSNDDGSCSVFVPGRQRNTTKTFIAHCPGFPKTMFDIDLSKVTGPVTMQIDPGLSASEPLTFKAQAIESDKTPLKGVRITIEEVLETSRETTKLVTDEEGRFAYTLKSSRPDGVHSTQGITVTVSNDDLSLLKKSSYFFEWHNQKWSSSENGPIEITALPTTKVEAILFDQNQTRIRNGKVWFYQSNPSEPNDIMNVFSQHLSYEVREDWKCDVYIPGFDPKKKLFLVAFAEGFGLKQVEVTIDQMNAPVPITLQRGQSHSITIQDEDGRPIPFAFVSLESVDEISLGQELNYQHTDKNGHVEFKCIPIHASRVGFLVSKRGYEVFRFNIFSNQQTGWPASSTVTLKKRREPE